MPASPGKTPKDCPSAAGTPTRSSRSKKRSADSPPGAAYAAFEENRLGVLRPGTRADLVVLDRDLFKATSMEILKTVVTATVIEGEVVFGN